MLEGNLYDRCRGVFLEGVLDALNRSKAHFESMQRTAKGLIPVNALALDIYPWHGSASLAVRVHAVPSESRYVIADWPNFDFANQDTSPVLKKAADLAADCYRHKPESMELIEAAHFIFLAAAEALLDPSVAETLQTFGIDAPKLGDGICGSHFEYLVLDADETCHSNYCEIVRANRTTDRLMEAWNTIR
ncbi:MAG TPA: hypothetical protein VHB99_13565 [Pirellulales bacterium]|nr:hypothetical protein [Pirellulales bacterium]